MKKKIGILLALMLVMNLTACTLNENNVTDSQPVAANEKTFEPGIYEGSGSEDRKEVAAQDLTTQVVVAGSGISGMMAAATAANEGMEVILVEKLGITGGSAGTAAGGAATAESELTPAEMDDSLDRIMAYVRLMNETSERQPNYEFLAAILGQTGTTVDYIAAELGVAPEEFEDRGDYVRSRYGSGRRLIDGLADHLAENGGVIMLNTKAEEIVMDGDRALGLRVSGEDGAFTIYADKVIIATGGASGNVERLLAADPQLANVALRNIASVGNTGDGFQMLEEIGAKMGDGPYPKPAITGFSSLRARTGITNLMLFDADGDRFCNEAPMFQTMTSAFLIRQGSTAYYALFSAEQTDEETLAALKEAAVGDDPHVAVYGETIEDLAEKLQIPAEKLRATFDRYQELCATGEDSDFGKSADNLIAYANSGGYYAAHVQPSAWGTFGGAITDEQFRVLREDGSVINNVFAVGECANSEFYGDYYQGAFSLGLYATTGRIAGQTAAAEIAGGQ